MVDEFVELLFKCQQVFGYIQEDFKFLMGLMVKNGEEGIGSMGNDSLFVVFLYCFKLFYNYFWQFFVQVINLLIDFICELVVMSLCFFVGLCFNLFDINVVNFVMCLEVE